VQLTEIVNQLLSIIIVNYCTRDLLRDCLASIRRNGFAGLETMVVDNHSSDDSVAMVEREFPEVRLITNRENLGFAKANNQAIRQSAAKYALLLNSDTVVLPGALQAMVAIMDQHADVGGVACRLRFEDGRIQPSARRTDSGTGLVWLVWRLSGVARLFQSDRLRQIIHRRCRFLLGSTIGAYLDSYDAGQSPMEVETLSGACLMLRAEAVKQVGWLDENFFMYLEDLDYCLRLRKAGWRLFYLPSAEIIHLAGQSSGGRMRKYNAEAFRSVFYFYRKHYRARSLLAARALVFVAFALHWAWNFLRGTLSNKTVFRQNCSEIVEVLQLCCEGGAYESSSPVSMSRNESARRHRTSEEPQKEKLHA
jgi:GT2 family glycosyltransferase